MQITIDIPNDIYQELCTRATASACSIDSLLESAVTYYLQRMRSENPKSPFGLPTFNMGGLLPGVDLDNSAALLDLMEADDPPPKDN